MERKSPYGTPSIQFINHIMSNLVLNMTMKTEWKLIIGIIPFLFSDLIVLIFSQW